MKDQTKTVGEDKEMMAPHKTYDIMGIKVDDCFLAERTPSTRGCSNWKK